MRLFTAALVSASLLVMPACVASQTAGQGKRIAVPATPVAVKNILYAQPFTVQTPFTTWSRERAKVSAGVLVVLEVDPKLIDPRDASVPPVLYAGNAAVIRLNHGNESGRIIGIVPGSVDLASEPIWFGSPELPERVTEATVRAERERASRAGVQPFSRSKIAAVDRSAVVKPDLAALLRDVAAELVYEFSPQEKELADAWRLPTANKESQPKP